MWFVGGRLILLLILGCVVSACGGSTAVDAPTSPSPTTGPASSAPQFPPLKGVWVGGHTMLLTNQENGVVDKHGCSQNWGITSQNGGEFSGSARTEGSSSSSDKFCSYSGTVTGVVAPDGTLTSLRFVPTMPSTGCTHVSGDGTFTGRMVDGTSLTAEMSDRWTCREILGEQRAGDRERTTTLTMRLHAPAN